MTLKIGVFIGRFQPFHNGHLRSLSATLENHDQVVVVLGSHNTLRSLKNPWTSAEREDMIRNSLRGRFSYKLGFHRQEDKAGFNEQWSSEIRAGVLSHVIDFHDKAEITLTGYYKDESSFYLDLFPEWKFVSSNVEVPVNATDIRELYFKEDPQWSRDLPLGSYSLLKSFKDSNLFKELLTLKANP